MRSPIQGPLIRMKDQGRNWPGINIPLSPDRMINEIMDQGLRTQSGSYNSILWRMGPHCLWASSPHWGLKDSGLCRTVTAAGVYSRKPWAPAWLSTYSRHAFTAGSTPMACEISGHCKTSSRSQRSNVRGSMSQPEAGQKDKRDSREMGREKEPLTPESGWSFLPAKNPNF